MVLKWSKNSPETEEFQKKHRFPRFRRVLNLELSASLLFRGITTKYPAHSSKRFLYKCSDMCKNWVRLLVLDRIADGLTNDDTQT